MIDETEQTGDDRTCVLVVEDELFIGIELEMALSSEGFRVIGPAATVEDALDLIAVDRPHAAVLDFNLGRDKVTPVALQLRSLGVPFVLASATAAEELARYEVLAMVTNVGKPTDAKRLVKAIRELSH